MKPEDFAAWLAAMRQRHGWTNADAARALGCGINMPGVWSRSIAPPYVALACAALAAGLSPWQRGLDE